MEILKILLGAGLGTGAVQILLAVLNRYWHKEDKKEEKEEGRRTETDERIDELFKRVEALVYAQKVTMIDRVKWLGRGYIANGEITLSDKDHLKEMHKAYKGLGGNGDLDTVMSEVDRLKIKEGR